MSIRTRMMIFFLVAFIIPTLVVVSLLYTTTRSTLRQRSIQHLQAITAWKKDKIETYFSLTLNNLKDIKGFLVLRQNIPVFQRHAGDPAHPEYVAAKVRLDERMERYRNNYGYLGIAVTDTNGIVVYSTPGTARVGEPLPGPKNQAFDAGKTGPSLNDIFLDPSQGHRPRMFGSGRFEDTDGHLGGVVAIELDMQSVYDILEKNTGLGETAESYIGKRDEDEILYLSPLRYDPASVLNRKDTLGGPLMRPLQLVLADEGDGVGFEKDYRGEKVVAAWQYMPLLQWGLVTKEDERGAFAAVTRLERQMALLVMLIVLAGASAAYLISRSITAPVKRLEEGARIMGLGKLDHKVGTSAQDEIGSLSRAFDHMAENLKVVYAELSQANTSLKMEIAERRKVEEEVRALNEGLEQRVAERTAEVEASNRELEAFSYSVSHDLRAPLRHIDGFGELLEKQAQDTLDANGRHYLQVIREASRNMGALIDALLGFSRMGRVALQKTAVPLDPLVRAIVADLKPDTAGRHIDWMIQPLPVAHGDMTLLRQVLANLIGNAIKYTRPKEKARIEIGTLEPAAAAEGELEPGFTGDEIVLYVRDNGVGFDMQYAGKLFGVFQRLHSASDFEGTGIGLANVRRIIARHGGRTWARGNPGEGATFYFTLPGPESDGNEQPTTTVREEA